MRHTAPNVEEIFYAALELEGPEARSAYLDRVCGDPELRRRIERLLAVDARRGDFLEAPAAMTSTPDSRQAIEEPGTAIGPYKLLEVIGEGGMGTVFMAEQAEPVRRRVALKVIKPGMDSKQVVARFEAERQALAMMDHPNIARVFDGGITPSCRPYFVMELVRGLPITEYCDAEKLSIPERLGLFVLVCRAVQHAHQKGIIHRDLKPSNILVTVIDGAAVPKVIDFGVAKATGQALTEKTLFTGFHQFVGTPLYVSPEQAELSGADVDTRSDIYSLGVLLYELLTGTTPFDAETLKRAAFDEMRRIIREEEPPRPSTRLSKLGDRLSTVSSQRKADPRRLGSSVKGELDWVVMKALEKDRRRRYETANDFAADVMRYLTDRPVEAHPPSAWYRFRKAALRHRKGLTLAVALTISGLVTVSLLVSWQLQEAGRRREVSQEVRQALAGARTAIEAGDLTLAGQRVSEAEGRLATDRDALADLGKQVERIRREIGDRRADDERFARFLKRTREVQDKLSMSREMGAGREAEEPLEIYAVLSDESWLSRLENTHLSAGQKEQVREAAYTTLVSLADSQVRWLDQQVDPEAAERSLELLRRAESFHEPTRAFYFVRSESHRRRGEAAAADEDARRFRSTAARTAWDYFLPGHTAGWRGDLDEAIRSYQSALALEPDHYNSLYFLASRLGSERANRYPEAIAYFSACLALRPHGINAYEHRARCYRKLGRLEEAEADYTAAIAAGSRDGYPYVAYEWRGAFYEEQGRRDEARQDRVSALEAHRNQLEQATQTLGRDHPQTLLELCLLAVACEGLERHREAIDLYEQALPKLRATLGPDDPYTLTTMNNLALAYAKAGRGEDAVTLLEQVLETKNALYGVGSDRSLTTRLNLGNAYVGARRWSEAIALLEPVLGEQGAIPADVTPVLVSSLANLALAYSSLGEWSRAIDYYERVLEGRKAATGPEDDDTLTRMGNLATCYAKVGRLTEAIDLAERVVEQRRARRGPGDPATLGALRNLAAMYQVAGKLAESEQQWRLVLETLRGAEGPRSLAIAAVLAGLGETLVTRGEFVEAEKALRECLAIRDEQAADDWRRFNAMSLLGSALMGQDLYHEAEPLLLRGYEGMKQREGAIPAPARANLPKSIERIIRLYEATNREEEARAWRERLPTEEDLGR